MKEAKIIKASTENKEIFDQFEGESKLPKIKGKKYCK
jgi:hypothetical protein